MATLADTPAKSLLETLEGALDMLAEYADAPIDDGTHLPSLLEQCEALTQAEPKIEPVRTLHHFACTGGTLISKCLAVMPNVTVLSEIDPLSPLIALPKIPAFAPTDLIYGARRALRPLSDDATVDVFKASLEALHKAFQDQGSYLCLRDHAHSQFCTDANGKERPTLDEIVAEILPVKSVVTVRHPLESYLSLIKNRWQHFSPATIEEYSKRYMLFLDRYKGVPVFRYEDFVAAPDDVLNKICDELALPFIEGAESMHQLVSLSGDSGRKSDKISARPRRPVPTDLAEQIKHSRTYTSLCARLEYAP